jgi:hypothetical protein
LSTVPDSITGDISENSLSCIQHQYTWVTNLSLPGFELNRTVLYRLVQRLARSCRAAILAAATERRFLNLLLSVGVGGFSSIASLSSVEFRLKPASTVLIAVPIR